MTELDKQQTIVALHGTYPDKCPKICEEGLKYLYPSISSTAVSQSMAYGAGEMHYDKYEELLNWRHRNYKGLIMIAIPYECYYKEGLWNHYQETGNVMYGAQDYKINPDFIACYIDVDEKEIDVHLTSKTNEDGTTAAPALYANIPIVSIKHTGDMDDEVVEKVQEVEEKKDNRPTDNAESIEEKSTDTAVEPKKEEKLEATNTDSKVEEKPVEEVSINKENGITEEQHKIEEVTKNEEKTTSETSDNSQDKIVKRKML